LLNPELKTLLSVGGSNLWNPAMSAMLSTEINRHKFAKTSIDYLRQWKFDGLDLAFVYPGSGGSPPEDKERFTQLLQVEKRS
jgi:chitinase